MPHINVKRYPGRTEEEKQQLADAISEEVAPGDWAEKVYKPCILEKEWTLYKKPGYNPFQS